ncbi:MAG: efflux transporter outer membrane subunit [Xanthobacteraceae bacterium]|nr:efflux transporter outer membrane subunit [Xanthobacteraceae bacterium]
MFWKRGPAVVALCGAAMLVSGCAVGPNFEHPAVPEASRYTKEPLPSHTSSAPVKDGQAQHFVNGRDIPGDWWTLYHSPGLNAVVRRALEGNPNLQAAIAAVRNAKELVYAEQGKFFPQAQANFNPTRQQLAQSIAPTLTNGAARFDLYTAQVTVAYALDIWGGERRSIESLQAQEDSQRFLVEAAYLTLTSNVVVAAIQEASLRGQIDATNQLITINSKMLELLRRQFMEGYANRNDVALQEAQLAQTRATLPPLRKALAQQRDLITALTGRLPADEPRETFNLASLTLPTELPVSLPSQLVEQRPDVRSATELLHSASAQIGVATANMLPNVTLSANGGYQAPWLAPLIAPQNVFWLIGANATQTVFDGFSLLHQRRAADALYDEAAWNYRQTVVTAFQNVADALRAIQNDADALKATNDFERASKTSLDLAQQQMASGNANFLYLLNAQVAYQNAVVQRVQAQATRLSDTAALYMALGGGWWNREGPPPEMKIDVLTAQVVPYGARP